MTASGDRPLGGCFVPGCDDPECPGKPWKHPESGEERLRQRIVELELRLEFRQQAIETVFATLIGFELPLAKAERFAESVRHELACGSPYLTQHPALGQLAQEWLLRLRELENETVERECAEPVPG